LADYRLDLQGVKADIVAMLEELKADRTDELLFHTVLAKRKYTYTETFGFFVF
jgi:hypothetical protein